MDNSVIIKGLNNGIIVVLDPTVEFELLKEKVTKNILNKDVRILEEV